MSKDKRPPGPGLTPPADPLERMASAAYRLSQSARVGAFMGQSWLSGRLTRPVQARRPVSARAAPGPDTATILKDLRELLARDRANIAAGVYRRPDDWISGAFEPWAGLGRYFRDLPRVERRRHARGGSEIFRAPHEARYPRYYLQNFHYQTDGWLSEESAALYDHQVEVLFMGGADVMRRQALVPIHAFMKQRQSAQTSLLDLGAGTGRFARAVKENYPRLALTLLELSPHYLARARRNLAPWPDVRYLEAAAEDSGLDSESFDLVTAVYLLHELPAKVRRAVVCEAARLLRPGGLFIVVDTILKGDRPLYDPLLERFPISFHEPYFADYVNADPARLLEELPLRIESVTLAYFSRIMAIRRDKR